MTLVRLEPVAPQSRVKHSTTEPLRSLARLIHINKIFTTKARRSEASQDDCLPIKLTQLCVEPQPRVGISGTTEKWPKRKFVPSSHPEPFVVVELSRKSQTMVGTLDCFKFLYQNELTM